MKATATGKDGAKLLVIGLSHRNLDKLREDGMEGFIEIDGGEIGWPGHTILITAGETEAAMASRFEELIGPDTKTTVADKLKQ